MPSTQTSPLVGRGLAGSAGADQERELARLEGQVDVVKREPWSVCSRYGDEINDRWQVLRGNGESMRSRGFRG